MIAPRIHTPFSRFSLHFSISLRTDLLHTLVELTGPSENKQKHFGKLIAHVVGQAGTSWYVDETYVRVHGKWCYLYRAVDRDGNLVDSCLSEKRDMEAAKWFFSQAVAVVGHARDRVTTDGHDSYPHAIREAIGNNVVHRTNAYLNNRIEQDHRGIKQR